LLEAGGNHGISLGPFEQQCAGDDLAAGVILASLLRQGPFQFARSFEGLGRFEPYFIDLFL
jgi:hypothetical protein